MGLNAGRKSLAEAGLTPQHREAVRMLAHGHSGKRVAQTIGVREATISRWINEFPAFRNEYRAQQALQWAESEGVASKAAHAALILAHKVIEDTDESTRNRLQAASIALNHRRALVELELRSRQVEALQERLDSLESHYQSILDVEVAEPPVLPAA